jgi:deoxyribonuclease-4
MLILGVHVGKKSKVLDNKVDRTLDVALKEEMDFFKLNAAQIFVMGPQRPIPAKLDEKKVREVTQDIDLTVHGCYLSVGLWKINKDNVHQQESKTRLNRLMVELKMCKAIGAWGYVVHIAKQLPEVIAETMQIIKPIAKKIGVTILLEMVASKSHPEKTYETPEKLDNLATLIGPQEDWWGFCVDTSHIWAAGVDVQEYSTMQKWLDRFTFKKKIKLWHLNGSSQALLSGKDRHAIPFDKTDKIWHNIKPEDSGAKAIIEYATIHNIPMILEINTGDQEETIKSLDTIKKLAGL